jgi:N-hydroxyarylamine O-acetyltransferase
MNRRKYLKRIGIKNNEIRPTLSNLKLLQKHHLLNIPFENLDIHRNIPITLDVNKFYRKIVENKRGGFCYELNGLFFELLKEMGFTGRIISARVSNGTGGFGEEYDHLAILTKIDGAEYLTDVGFGDFIGEPLKFILDEEQEDENGTFLIRKFDNEYFEVVKKDSQHRNSEYIFRDLARDLSEFAGMCEFHQGSGSHFSKGRVCSLMTDQGRKTLTDKKFIETVRGVITETDIISDRDFQEILEREFGISKKRFIIAK